MADSPYILIGKCREIGLKAHSGQFRRDGVTPYFTHCEAVASRVDHLGHEYTCVALLHDVIEDTEVTTQALFEAGVPDNIIRAVWLLTKPESCSYTRYLTAIRSNELARQVKIADMLSNLADKPTNKQIRKYAQGLLYLVDAE